MAEKGEIGSIKISRVNHAVLRTEMKPAVRRAPTAGVLAAAGLGLLLLLLAGLPYLLAVRPAGDPFVFNGFLLNPLDGNTYLAKMYAGWRGDWRFTLPYTAEPGEGAYIFMFYLGLGHLARVIGLSLPLTFHIARLVSALVMLLALYHFIERLVEEEDSRILTFALAAFGSGLGWVALLFGGFTSDFWVAETYPFLSAYANPHFPLGLALLLALLTPNPQGSPTGAGYFTNGLPRGLLYAAGSFALGIIQPFGVVIAVLILGGTTLWEALAELSAKERVSPVAILRAAARLFTPGGRFMWVSTGGSMVLIYTYLAILADPQLSGWNAQNLTPTPPTWDLLLSLSPALLAALAGIWVVWKRRLPAGKLLLVWIVLGAALLYLPVGIQRRFLLGFYVPAAVLAGLGLSELFRGMAGRGSRRWRLAWALVLLLSLPTNLIVLLAGLKGAQARDPALYLSAGEFNALDWLRENTAPDALVLASPSMGLFIPAYTGRRVVYGHPYETVNAAGEEAAVGAFFEGDSQEDNTARNAFLAGRGVDFIFYGDRERLLGEPVSGLWLREVYRAGEVTVYDTAPGK
jgi:hypothetical protein